MSSIKQVRTQQKTRMKGELDRRNNFVPREGDEFGKGRRLRGDVASKQATEVSTIGARPSRSAAAPVADRRVAGDELLIDRIGCVQTSHECLQRKAARECMRNARSDGPCARDGHHGKYRDCGVMPTRTQAFGLKWTNRQHGASAAWHLNRAPP